LNIEANNPVVAIPQEGVVALPSLPVNPRNEGRELPGAVPHPMKFYHQG